LRLSSYIFFCFAKTYFRQTRIIESNNKEHVRSQGTKKCILRKRNYIFFLQFFKIYFWRNIFWFVWIWFELWSPILAKMFKILPRYKHTLFLAQLIVVKILGPVKECHFYLLFWPSTPGGGNIRPASHIRPAKANFFSFDCAFLTEMWPERH